MTIAGRMAAYISEYYQNGLSLEMLSEEFHFSKNHIINLFKQEYYYIQKGESYAFFVVYHNRMDILTFGKMSLYYPVKVIGFPCSLSYPGYVTNDEKFMLDYIKIYYRYYEIIIFTSMPEFSYLDRAKKIGVDSFWYKEVSEEELLKIGREKTEEINKKLEENNRIKGSVIPGISKSSSEMMKMLESKELDMVAQKKLEYEAILLELFGVKNDIRLNLNNVVTRAIEDVYLANKITELANRVIKEDLSVRELEEISSNSNFNTFDYKEYSMIRDTFYHLMITDYEKVGVSNNLIYSIKKLLLK